MPSHDILGNDALVAPAALARAVVPLFVFYTGPDRRFIQEMQDQSIKRSSSVKELGDWRRSQLREWQPWVVSGPLVIRHTDKAARSLCPTSLQRKGSSSYSEDPWVEILQHGEAHLRIVAVPGRLRRPPGNAARPRAFSSLRTRPALCSVERLGSVNLGDRCLRQRG
jgi:hypothetical protein